MLKLDNVTSFYGKTPILKNVNLGIDQGQCLCVLGRNGVGKTTLLQTIMGLTTRTTGELTVDGQDVSGYSTYRRAKAGLGYIPQGRRILGRFSVAENIRLGTFARKDDSRKLPDICLEMFPYLAENLNRRAGLLSGGQQQQLAIARALATDPSILLLDEPTEGIQPNIVAEIKAALVKLNRDMGITLVLTEQHIDIAKSIGHKFVVLDVGRVVHEGRIDELTQDVVEQHLTI